MQIIYRKGNIFDCNADVLVNPVNCVGVAGAGLALQFRNNCPGWFEDYKVMCDLGYVRPGHITTYAGKNYTVYNFPTKRHWRDKSLAQDIILGMQQLIGMLYHNDVKSIAIPPIGCGLGGLNWEHTRNYIAMELINVEHDFPDLWVHIFDK